MNKRHKDAIAISDGACNPSGICYVILEACAEIRSNPDHKGTAEITSDPAIRLMVYQLAAICGMEPMGFQWEVCRKKCEEHANNNPV